MTTYFVDSVLGVDSNAGSAAGASALKSLDLAVAKAIAGDVIYFSAPTTVPFRGGTTSASAVAMAANFTIIGDTSKSYVVPMYDISHGAAYDEVFMVSRNLNLEGFVSAAVPHLWDLGGDAPAEETGAGNFYAAGGSTRSLKFYKTASSPSASRTLVLPKNKTVTLSYWRKEAASSFGLTIRDLTTTSFWTGSAWGANTDLIPTGSTGGVYESKVFTTNPNTTTRYTIGYTFSLATTNAFLDSVSIAVTGTRAWVNVSGNIYQMDDVVDANGTTTWPASVLWGAAGAVEEDMLPLLVSGPSLQVADVSYAAFAARNQAGTYWFDSATKVLYVNAGSENILTKAIKVGFTTQSVYQTSASDIRNVKVIGSAQGFTDHQSGIAYQRNCTAKMCSGNGFFYDVAGCRSVALDCIAEDIIDKDGFVSVTANCIPTWERCISRRNSDDGFQASNINANQALQDCGSFVAISCLAYGNGVRGTGAGGRGQGFVAENSSTHASGDVGYMKLYGCTSYGNYADGIRVTKGTNNGVTTSEVKNCITYGNGAGSAVIGTISDLQVDYAMAAGNIKNNIVGTYEGINNYAGVLTNNNVVADPLFVDVSDDDFRLKTGSPAYRAGVYTAAKTDVRGRRRQVPPSIGAYEPSSGDACPVARVARS